MKENRSIMIYLYAGSQTRARYYSWDGITGISTRGKRGTLASAITCLPARKGLYERCLSWATDLKKQGFLPVFEQLIPISPFTSQACGPCFLATGKMKRTRKANIPYNAHECLKCGIRGNRHSNSAQVSALLVKKHVTAQS